MDSARETSHIPSLNGEVLNSNQINLFSFTFVLIHIKNFNRLEFSASVSTFSSEDNISFHFIKNRYRKTRLIKLLFLRLLQSPVNRDLALNINGSWRPYV